MNFKEMADTAYNEWVSDKPTLIAVDTETTGVAYFDTPFCVSLAWDRDEEDYQSHYIELDSDESREYVTNILSHTPELVFHNAKFDMQKLGLVGLFAPTERDPSTVHDTEALAHLLDEHRIKKLKVLAKDLLGEETDEAEAIRAAKREHKLTAADGFDKLPRDVIIPYAKKDAEFTIRLFDNLYPKLAAYSDLLGLYSTEQKLTFVLLEMESRGMRLDIGYAEAKAKEYNTKALTQELLIRDMVDNEEFNPNSPKQVTEAFADLNITLAGTGKEVLREVDHPLAQSILELRTLRKMHSTYLKPMLSEQRDGVIHPSFRQHGTKTGRMSSGGQEAS